MTSKQPKRTALDVFSYIAMRHQNPNVCWPWNSTFSKKRPVFKLKGKNVNACRLVFKQVNGESSLADDDVVRHTCDNGDYPIGCCNPHHLVKGSHQDNMDDMVDRERHGMPQKHRREILELLAEGHKQHKIAAIYNISREAVSAIANGRVKVRE